MTFQIKPIIEFIFVRPFIYSIYNDWKESNSMRKKLSQRENCL